jgi:peptidyl-prolyl cis-trans isomerase C
MDEVLVTVNGEPQSAARAELLLRDEIARGAADTPELRAGVRDALVQDALMAQAALSDGLDRLPLVRAQIEMARQNILARAWQQQLLQQQSITAADLQAEYSRHLQGLGAEELQLSHLLARDQASAAQWLVRLARGEDMAALAAESLDSESRPHGGFIDWTAEGRIHPEIVVALARLAPGRMLSRPVQSPSGWHVLRLQARRPLQAPSLADCRELLVKNIAQRRLMQRVRVLREQALIA